MTRYFSFFLFFFILILNTGKSVGKNFTFEYIVLPLDLVLSIQMYSIFIYSNRFSYAFLFYSIKYSFFFCYCEIRAKNQKENAIQPYLKFFFMLADPVSNPRGKMKTKKKTHRKQKTFPCLVASKYYIYISKINSSCLRCP